MTRINVGIHPNELPVKLLMAELREIKRIPNCIKKGRYSLVDQPKEFRLGKGHVKFFYDKMLYLYKRYQALRKEALIRGYNPSNYSISWVGVPKELMNDYKETERDRQIILERFKKKGHELL